MLLKEGIDIRDEGEGLSALITRVDSTSITFFDSVANLVSDLQTYSDSFVVLDLNVSKIYRNELKCIVKGHTYILEEGEKEKSWTNLANIMDGAILSRVSRKGAFIAIGGGVVTDMVGLASNLYFRGVDSIHVPTTLLGMVDAAIGGKVAVNHPFQKNLLGSFYHPSRILICTEFLDSVHERHMYSAAGEILKLAVLSKTDLLEKIEQAPRNWIKNQEFLKDIVKICIKEKLLMLGANCFERDLKRPLNLGHSVAHPIEDITDFRILHGEAVAYGVLVACIISRNRGLLKREEYARIYSAAQKMGCTLDIKNLDRKKLWERINRLVLQRGGKGLLYVLPVSDRETVIVNKITRSELFGALDELSKCY